MIVPPGRVERPQGLAVARLAADRGRRRRPPAGGLRHRRAAHPDASGTGPGQPSPASSQSRTTSAIDPLGRVFVADNSNHRSSATARRRAYTYRGALGLVRLAARASCSTRAGSPSTPTGETFVADPGGNRIDVFDIGGDVAGLVRLLRARCRASSSGRSAWAPTRAGCARSRTRSTAAIAAAEPGRQRRRDVRRARARPDAAARPGGRRVRRAPGCSTCSTRSARACSSSTARGKIIRTIGARGPRPGQAARAVARWRSPPAGTVYVADTGNGRIVRFTTGGTHLGSFGRFRAIRGVAVSPDGSRVYAADAGTNRITVLDRHGRRPGRDRRRARAGQLRSPGEIALDGAGNVWVADRGNDRVVRRSRPTARR